jgi:1-acyl-sn-glycerol-3-phosphate acyltransferase
VRTELDAWWRTGRLVVVPLARALFRMRFLRGERIPERGPAIIAANHVSMLDGIVLAIPPVVARRRRIRFLTGEEFFRTPVVGFLLRHLGQIPIHRGEGDRGALEEVARTIRGGALAGIFPEGHVNRGDPGELQRIHTGAARIALETRAPILPVGVWGTQLRWPPTGPRIGPPWRPPLTIAFGLPIEPSEDDRESEEVVEALTRRIHDGMLEAREDARADAEHRAGRSSTAHPM